MKASAKMIVVVLSLALVSAFVFGAPTEPIAPVSVTRVQDSRIEISDYSDISRAADAGNITEFTITGIAQTKAWSGFYGNITGNISLKDADGYVFFDWYEAEPQGEIYAANGSVSDWSTVRCVNYTNNGIWTGTYDGGTKSTTDTNAMNLTTIEDAFGIVYDDVDGVDETFNESGRLYGSTDLHQEFYVGTIEISGGTCPATDTYESSTKAGTNFQEVLLTINNSHTVIFASIIENNESGISTDVTGYRGAGFTPDFQMLVLEDGHDGAGADASTPYYFYVELE